MTHNVCTGTCGGVADAPGVCQTDECVRKGQPLTECNCTDGGHAEVKNAPPSTSSESA